MSDPESNHAPLPLAGGAGGGRFKPRNTARAKELRNQASPAEHMLWRALNGRKIGGYKFSRQMPIGPFFADFLCREVRLVVELDGYSHDTRQEYDRKRDAYLRAEGYSVLRFTNEDVLGNVDGVAQAIALVLIKMRPPPTPPASGRGEKGTEQKMLGISLEGSVG